jgi:hypothetical protein
MSGFYRPVEYGSTGVISNNGVKVAFHSITIRLWTRTGPFSEIAVFCPQDVIPPNAAHPLYRDWRQFKMTTHSQRQRLNWEIVRSNIYELCPFQRCFDSAHFTASVLWSPLLELPIMRLIRMPSPVRVSRGIRALIWTAPDTKPGAGPA